MYASPMSPGRSGKSGSNEETIRRVLSSYEIGAKLRQLRLQRKIALVDLGRHTGLSASMLSQLENNKLVPTLPTLVRIATVFDVGVEYFFGDRKRETPFVVLRKDDRIRFPDRPDNPTPNYFFEYLPDRARKSPCRCISRRSYAFRKRPSRSTHEGTEFLYVLEGCITVRYNNEDHVLRQGDGAYFDASGLHSYRAMSKTPARAVVVTVAS